MEGKVRNRSPVIISIQSQFRFWLIARYRSEINSLRHFKQQGGHEAWWSEFERKLSNREMFVSPLSTICHLHSYTKIHRIICSNGNSFPLFQCNYDCFVEVHIKFPHLISEFANSIPARITISSSIHIAPHLHGIKHAHMPSPSVAYTSPSQALTENR